MIRRSALTILFVIGLTYVGCSRQGSAEQKIAFQNAVALESKPQSFSARQEAYMKVVAIDPGSEYGKAAAERVAQLNKIMESAIGGK